MKIFVLCQRYSGVPIDLFLSRNVSVLLCVRVRATLFLHASPSREFFFFVSMSSVFCRACNVIFQSFIICGEGGPGAVDHIFFTRSHNAHFFWLHTFFCEMEAHTFSFHAMHVYIKLHKYTPPVCTT